MPKVKLILFIIRTAAMLECGVLEGREEPALTISKSPLSAPVSGVGETKEVDQSPLSEARADPMILAVAGDVSSEKSNKPLQHKKHKRHGESSNYSVYTYTRFTVYIIYTCTYLCTACPH